MPTVSNQPSEEYLPKVADDIIVEERKPFINLSKAESIDGLSIFGNKPNAIVRPLQHLQSHDGLNGYVETELIKVERNEAANKKDFNKDKFRSFGAYPKETTNEHKDEFRKRPLFITTVPRGIFLPPIQPLPAVPKKIYNSQPKIFQNLNNNNRLQFSQNDLHLKSSSLSASIEANLFKKPLEHEHKLRKLDFSILEKGITGRKIIVRDNQNNGVMQSQGRIIRGSNFNHMTSGEGDSTQKDMETRRRIMSRKVQPIRYPRNLIGTPPPVKGRRHENVQTERYLEELFDRPAEYDVSVQTDLFLQRPPTPQYVPEKSGVDVYTDIPDGDLFDFDTEVQPILEVLVGRTLEQAIIEVMHEEELTDLKEQQQRLLAKREKEEAEIKRLELEEKRLSEEKRRRLAQDEITEDVDKEIQERVTAAKLLQGHIADLLPGILEDLDPLKDAEDRLVLEEQLKPWLAQQVAEEIGHMVDSRELLEEIVKQVLKHRAELYTTLEQNRKAETADDMDAEDEVVAKEEGEESAQVDG